MVVGVDGILDRVEAFCGAGMDCFTVFGSFLFLARCLFPFPIFPFPFPISFLKLYPDEAKLAGVALGGE